MKPDLETLREEPDEEILGGPDTVILEGPDTEIFGGRDTEILGEDANRGEHRSVGVNPSFPLFINRGCWTREVEYSMELSISRRLRLVLYFRAAIRLTYSMCLDEICTNGF